MREYIDGAALRDMILCVSAALESNKQTLNELNVFPVPDGDTGTNMSLTMGSAATELRKKQPKTVSAVADCVAGALLRGARGNSGVIMSLLFRGLAKGLKGKDTADCQDFAAALAEGVEIAYKAVMKPAEGTILTVSRLASATAVKFAEAGTDIELMLAFALESANEALADTINLNPVLKRAGVVDAGGRGYVIILDAMLGSLRGTLSPVETTSDASVAPSNKADFSDFDTGEIQFGYCTEFIVSKENHKSIDLLRAFLGNLGDSLVVVDDDEIIKVHVHTNDPGKALTEALTYGSLLTVKVENMREQHTSLSGNDDPAPEETAESESIAAPEKKYGVVAVCAGEGLGNLFRQLGVDGIVSGGQTMNPSTEDILKEINRTPAEIVYVFPNNKNIIMAAEQCIPLTEKQVIVIPSKTVPQGISALLNMDETADEATLTAAFQEAIANVRTALVTYAARDSDFDGHTIHAGEYLVLLDGTLVGSYADQPLALHALLSAFSAFSPEFISIYYGEDVTAETAEETAALFEMGLPNAEVNIVDGGQPVYYYMVSAE